jgi:hypothetical protein
MSKVKEIPTTVLGKVWVIRLMKRKKYKKKNGGDSRALVYFEKRRIDLSPRGRELEIITHELVHAFLYEMCVDPHTMTVDDLEEVYCDLMAKHGQTLLDTAKDIYSRIQAIETPVT